MPETRQNYRFHLNIPTRWMDNDVYGHVNNVVYYSFFDTAVNRFLIDEGGLDIHTGSVIGFVVETQCRYFQPVAFPDAVSAGVRVANIGNSSVRYEVGIFKAGADEAIAEGHFVHVYVDRTTQRPTRVPDDLRAALTRLMIEEKSNDVAP